MNFDAPTNGIQRGSEPEKDRRLGRMITLSAVLHAAAIVCLIIISAWSGSSKALPVAYTVELVNPAALGTSLPGAQKKAPVAKPTRQNVPAPKPTPPAPEKQEPQRRLETKASPEPEPQKETPPPEAKEVIKLPQKEKPVKKPPVKPPPKETRSAQQKPPVKKAETKPPPQRTETKPQEKRIAERRPERPTLSPEERERYLSSSLERIKRQVRAGEKERSGNSEAVGTGPPTLGAAAGEGGGGLVRGLAFIMYTEQVKRRVKESWIVAEQRPGLIATVRFGIEPDGSVFGVQLTRSSGDGAFDQSVLRAVRKADPLPPPPQDYRYEFAEQRVEVTFGDENRTQ